MDCLLDDPKLNSREHVLETASYHVSNVKEQFSNQFERLVTEISSTWGHPVFTCTLDDEKKIAPPKWSIGEARDGGVPRTLKLTYWKRDGRIDYIALRTEIDEEKERNLYYEIVIGARRRTGDSVKIEAIRHSKPTFWGTIRSWFVWS